MSGTSKIWYAAKNNRPYPTLPGIVAVTASNFETFSWIVLKCIDLFNSEIKWEEMWTIEDAEKRLDNGETLYITMIDGAPVGFLWVRKGYLYNAFVSNTRPKNHTAKFLLSCWNTIEEDEITWYCDEWNKPARMCASQILKGKRVGEKQNC